jgi:hypothetical protein
MFLSHRSPFQLSAIRYSLCAMLSASVALTLAGCDTMLTDQYDATAQVSYTWQVQYSPNLGGDRPPRIQRFASTTLVNHNGIQPDDAVTGPDDRGLWWPALPTRPTVDQIEARQRNDEEMSTPELIKSEEYLFTYTEGGQTKTLPANYQVYRQAVLAYADKRPLELTLGVEERSVIKAEPR